MENDSDKILNKVTVRVPGTSANCGPGFDCLGLAATIYNDLELTLLEEKILQIEAHGDGGQRRQIQGRNFENEKQYPNVTRFRFKCGGDCCRIDGG